MSIEQLIILALIQGITEFLPISSSGHLNLLHELTNWGDQGVLMDVAVHAGTLVAVVAYFRQDVWRLILGGLTLLKGEVTADGRLALYIILATLPAVVVGYALLQSGAIEALRTAEIVAWGNLIFAGLLWWADKTGATEKKVGEMTWGQALAIGVAQMFALIPGASRSGSTITMARWLGYERQDAARFSMLLSIPVILGAGLASTFKVVETGNFELGMDMVIAATLACLTAFGAIAIFMKMLESMSMLPFVLYRVVLGIGLLVWVYWL
ncbi:MAG: undecaprenyl-diphosphatase [Parvibaculaceae bacterium]|jgi:undecaprenyl-diphosphatase|nr:undecaprenyl-diphosphate phosphatase [Parvibaculaceae bacterium]